MMTAALRIRQMCEQDLPAVCKIECSTYSFPWTMGIFRDCIAACYVCLIAEDERGLSGYLVMSVACGEVHILNLSVDPERQGQGVGRLLLDYGTELACATEARAIYLEVRPSNTAALKLYRGSGFQVVGRRKGYYRAPTGKEDALVLSRSLPLQSTR